jgi:hypothetical protein
MFENNQKERTNRPHHFKKKLKEHANFMKDSAENGDLKAGYLIFFNFKDPWIYYISSSLGFHRTSVLNPKHYSCRFFWVFLGDFQMWLN